MQAGRRLLLATLAAVPLLALGAGAASSTRASVASWRGDAQLAVTAISDGYPELHIALDLPDEAGAPGRITLYVPRGFAIYPDRPPDSAVGTVQITAQDDSYGSFTNSSLAGDIVAQPAPTTDATCTPGPYVGVWQLELSLLGQSFDVPIYVERTGAGDPPGAATKLVLCAPALPAADPTTARAFPISTLDLFLTDVEAPSNHGSYLWRAVVVPLAVDRKTLRPAHSYELRANLLVPNRLTLAGHLQAITHTALLHGRLTGNGAARGQVPITIIALIRRVTPTGAIVNDHTVANTTTSARGSYRVRVPLKRATTFIAIARPTIGRCHGAAIAPAGCRNTTTPPAESEPLTLTP